MKNQWRLWGMIPLVLLGLAACNKDDAATQDQGKGNVKITFGFEQALETKAGTGPKKPATSWGANVKDLIILFVDNNGTVKDARNITPPEGEGIAAKSVTLQNIAAGTYDVHVVANSGVAANITRKGGWKVENAVGRRLAELYLDMVPLQVLPEGFSGTGYKEPAEIFTANQSVSVVADATTSVDQPFSLTRAVSLIRVRLIPVEANDTKIDFTDELGAGSSAIFLRRTELALNIPGTLEGKADDKGIFINTPFLTQDPTDYAGDQPIVGGATGVKYFKDFLSLPGGGVLTDPSANKFDLVIKGTTKTDDYIIAGSTTPVLKGTPVYWSGPVNQKIDANGILDIVVTLKTYGEKDEPTPGTTYGNLDIQVNLTDWGAVTNAEMEL